MRWEFFAFSGVFFLVLGAIMWIVNDHLPFAAFFGCFAFMEFAMAAGRLIAPPVQDAS